MLMQLVESRTLCHAVVVITWPSSKKLLVGWRPLLVAWRPLLILVARSYERNMSEKDDVNVRNRPGPDHPAGSDLNRLMLRAEFVPSCTHVFVANGAQSTVGGVKMRRDQKCALIKFKSPHVLHMFTLMCS